MNIGVEMSKGQVFNGVLIFGLAVGLPVLALVLAGQAATRPSRVPSERYPEAGLFI